MNLTQIEKQPIVVDAHPDIYVEKTIYQQSVFLTGVGGSVTPVQWTSPLVVVENKFRRIKLVGIHGIAVLGDALIGDLIVSRSFVKFDIVPFGSSFGNSLFVSGNSSPEQNPVFFPLEGGFCPLSVTMNVNDQVRLQVTAQGDWNQILNNGGPPEANNCLSYITLTYEL